MPHTWNDGSVSYEYPDQFTDILLNGVSVIPLGVIEMRIWPDGHGYICSEKLNPTDAVKVWVDGQTKNFTQYGDVQIVP